MWPFSKKKEDDLAQFERDLGIQPGDRLGLDSESKPIDESYDKLGADITAPEQPRFESRRPEQSLQQVAQTADLQLIAAKLDVIRAMIETLNQRMSNLERNAQEKEKQKLWQ